jgi:hypothetical protein
VNKTGTKLSCQICGSQLAVTKGGDGVVHCCDRPMDVVAGAQQSTARPSGPITVDDPFYS